MIHRRIRGTLSLAGGRLIVVVLCTLPVGGAAAGGDIPELQSALQRGDVARRLQAVRGLSALKTGRARALLWTTLESDPSPHVRKRCLSFLAENMEADDSPRLRRLFRKEKDLAIRRLMLRVLKKMERPDSTGKKPEHKGGRRKRLLGNLGKCGLRGILTVGAFYHTTLPRDDHGPGVIVRLGVAYRWFDFDAAFDWMTWWGRYRYEYLCGLLGLGVNWSVYRRVRLRLGLRVGFWYLRWDYGSDFGWVLWVHVMDVGYALTDFLWIEISPVNLGVFGAIGPSRGGLGPYYLSLNFRFEL